MIETSYFVEGYASLPGTSRASGTESDVTVDSFAMQLNGQMTATAGQDAEENSDISDIKEKGLVAFIMENHEEQIRKEILKSMGLTEEDLAKMPPEQRAMIEKLIAEETRKRMAAEALMRKKGEGTSETDPLEEVVLGLEAGALSKIEAMETAFFSSAVQEKDDR